jgi:hypothetical protein
VSSNNVARSFGEAAPETPSDSPSIEVPTCAWTPASFLDSAMASKAPTPPRSTTVVARAALGRSASAINEVPPGLQPRMMTSSALKSVGLSRTRIPLARRHSVTPNDGIARSPVMRPGAGRAGTRAPSPTSSVQATTGVRSASPNVLSSASRPGKALLSREGADRRTTRLASVIHRRPTWLTSSRVIPGRRSWTARNSHAIPGVGSPLRKWSTYSPV